MFHFSWLPVFWCSINNCVCKLYLRKPMHKISQSNQQVPRPGSGKLHLHNLPPCGWWCDGCNRCVWLVRWFWRRSKCQTSWTSTRGSLCCPLTYQWPSSCTSSGDASACHQRKPCSCLWTMCCPRLGEDRSGTDVQMLSFVHDPKKWINQKILIKKSKKQYMTICCRSFFRVTKQFQLHTINSDSTNIILHFQNFSFVFSCHFGVIFFFFFFF